MKLFIKRGRRVKGMIREAKRGSEKKDYRADPGEEKIKGARVGFQCRMATIKK